MKIAVVGLWHLGCVTAACLAKAGYQVMAYDPDEQLINHLKNGKPPLFEPGLTELLQEGQQAGLLQYTSLPSDISQTDIIWVNFDTPVDDHDQADVEFVFQQVQSLFRFVKENATMILSSQVPIGTTRKLKQLCERDYPHKIIHFVYIPENLRLGKAISVFMNPDRIIVGIENENSKKIVQDLLKPFSENLIWMSIESAEMTKHALNAFLAVSVSFINELSTLCEKLGANAYEVEKGLKSEERIGPKAYLKPGGAIGGGTLLRDVNFLKKLGEEQNHPTLLFSAILESNNYHKKWLYRKMLEKMGDLNNRTITVLGLTYKANTDTLRRSLIIEACHWLNQQGSQIKAFDPAITTLPSDLAKIIDLRENVEEALQDSEAIVIATDWPQFSMLPFEQFSDVLIFDPNGLLSSRLQSAANYYSVGTPS